VDRLPYDTLGVLRLGGHGQKKKKNDPRKVYAHTGCGGFKWAGDGDSGAHLKGYDWARREKEKKTLPPISRN